MPSSHNDLLEFGPWRANPVERQLSRAGEVVPLTSKAFDVLLLLLRNPGRTVTKEEFMEAVWAGTVVEESNLSDNISTLRQALGDDAKQPRYIQTVPRRGYKFVAEVRSANAESLETTSSRSSEPAPNGPRTALLALASLILVGAIAAGAWMWSRRAAAEPVAGTAQPLRTIAVFPFDPLGNEASETHLGVSLADAVITQLTSVRELVVRPPSAVLGYAGAKHDAMQAAREQGVDAFVEGRVLQRGNHVRVTVQLVSVREPRTLWARTFDHDTANLFEVEDQISSAVARELSVRMDRRPAKHVPDPEAYELYGAGRYLWAERTPESLEKSVDCFQRALAIDGDFALAQAGLADAYSAMGIWNYKPPAETFPLAKKAALAALALDPDLAEARTSLGYVLFRYDWDLREAEKEFVRALAASPNSASTHVFYGEYLTVVQRFDEAEVELQKARKLDPRSHYLSMMSAVRHYFMRDYSAAAAEARGILQADPQYFVAREFLWAVYREAGDERRSVATRLETLNPNGVSAETVAALRAVYERAGIREYRHAENQYLLSQARDRYVPAVYLAMNHAQNGENDEAMRWLEKAYQERSGWLLEMRVDPVWDKIRSDPRFIALEKRVFGA